MAPRAPHPVMSVLGAGSVAAAATSRDLDLECEAPLMSPLSDAHQVTPGAPPTDDYELFFSFAADDSSLDIADPFAKPLDVESLSPSPSSSRHSLIRPTPSVRDLTLESVEPNAELLHSLDDIFTVNHAATPTADLTFADDDPSIDPLQPPPPQHKDPLADHETPKIHFPVIPHQAAALVTDADDASSVRVMLPLSKKGWSDKSGNGEAQKLRKIRKRPPKHTKRRSVQQPTRKRARSSNRVNPPPNRSVNPHNNNNPPATAASAAAAAADPKLPDPPVRERCVRCSTPAKNTPMMRKGPDGCRSLCNACGLKWSRHGIY